MTESMSEIKVLGLPKLLSSGLLPLYFKDDSEVILLCSNGKLRKVYHYIFDKLISSVNIIILPFQNNNKISTICLKLTVLLL